MTFIIVTRKGKKAIKGPKDLIKPNTWVDVYKDDLVGEVLITNVFEIGEEFAYSEFYSPLSFTSKGVSNKKGQKEARLKESSPGVKQKNGSRKKRRKIPKGEKSKRGISRNYETNKVTGVIVSKGAKHISKKQSG